MENCTILGRGTGTAIGPAIMIEERPEEYKTHADWGMGARMRLLQSLVPTIVLDNPRLTRVLQIAFSISLCRELYLRATHIVPPSGALWHIKFNLDVPVAECDFGARCIYIHPSLNTDEQLLDAVIFELCNAIHFEKFSAIERSSKDEEEFAMHNELIELQTAKQHHVIVQELSTRAELASSGISWSKVDIYANLQHVSPERWWALVKHRPHADFYRQDYRQRVLPARARASIGAGGNNMQYRLGRRISSGFLQIYRQ